MKRTSVLLAAALVLVAGACKPRTETANVKPGAVKVELFAMSQCPFGVQAEDNMKEALDTLGADVDFSVDFIGKSENGELTSMHGPTEVVGDKVQLCAAQYAPNKYRELIACQNKNYKDVATNWEQCATDAKMPVDKIKACATGEEGKTLLAASFKKSEDRKAAGSPTIYIGGKQYTGRRGSTDIFRAVCAEYKEGSKPEACSKIPEPAKVTVQILSDKRCTDCNADRYSQMLKARMGNPDIKMLDIADPEGKKLYDTVGGEPNLPLIVFDATLDADKESSQMFARGLQAVGGGLKSLQVGGKWSPVCMAEKGCELEKCKNTIACRKETPGTLDVFVMSQCPFGVRALNAMPEVLKAFGKEINFKVHYIADADATGAITSMHGQGEVDENIRELCAMKLYGKDHKYMDYVLCRNKDIKSAEWQKCATGGVDAKAMEKCVAAEGKQILATDMKVAKELGFGASPTWLANGKYEFSGVDAASIQKSFCEHNKSLKGCSVQIAAPAPAAAAPAAGGGGSCGN